MVTWAEEKARGLIDDTWRLRDGAVPVAALQSMLERAIRETIEKCAESLKQERTACEMGCCIDQDGAIDTIRKLGES